MTEHEFDHVFVGEWNGVPEINPNEVESYKWLKVDDVEKDMIENPEVYTEWFKIIYQEFLKYVRFESNRK